MIKPTDIGLHQILVDWLGPGDSRARALPAQCNWLPEPLKDWYVLSSKWNTPIVQAKQLREPIGIHPADGYAIFLEDATQDWIWAFDPVDPNVVYDREFSGEWQQTAEPLGEFLVHNAIDEVIRSAGSSRECDRIATEKLEHILAPMTEVSFKGWRWPLPGGRIFIGDEIAAEVAPTMGLQRPWEPEPGYCSVRVTACDPSSLIYLETIAGIQWIADI